MAERTHHQPETLDDLASRIADSAPDCAETIRACALAWQHDQRELQQAQDDNTVLQRNITQAQRVLAPRAVA